MKVVRIKLVAQAACLLGASLLSASALAADFELVTPLEFQESLDAGENPAHDYIAKSVPGGPQISIVSPTVAQGKLESPVDIEVKFVPSDDATIDMSSLKIYYLMFVKKDVTRRLLEHAEVGEDSVRASGAKLPSGKHKFLLEISDNFNRKGSQKFVVEVKS